MSATALARTNALPVVLAEGSITFGCDPEFFFWDTNTKQIIGAEKILPKDGLQCYSKEHRNFRDKIIIDGVQAELNVSASTCRESLATYVNHNLQSLNTYIKKEHGNVIELVFDPLVEITVDELKTLDPKNQVFGCAPSSNLYEPQITIKADPMEYLYRSAGGHLHLGHNPGDYGSAKLFKALQSPDKLIPLLDILVGNTAVLLDRNPGNAERRKNYGRAGEFRLPPHGIEYRTLSNFWLRATPLMSLMFGLARLAVQLVVDNKSHDFVKAFTSAVIQDDIIKAINENDFELALSNYNKVEPLIKDVTKGMGAYYGLNSENLHLFRHLVKRGIDHWFKGSPIEYWRTNSNRGFQTFSFNELDTDYRLTNLPPPKPVPPVAPIVSSEMRPAIASETMPLVFNTQKKKAPATRKKKVII